MLLALTAFCPFVLTVALMPLAKRWAVKLGAIDRPVSGKIHREPIARIGGVAFAAAGMLFLCALWLLAPALLTVPARYVLAGAGIATLVGLMDDCLNVRPVVKLAGLLLAGGVLSLGAVPTGWPMYLGVPVLTIFVAGTANATNMIDGLDGQAAGVVLLGLLGLTWVFLHTGNQAGVFIAMTAAGGCLGFLTQNRYPASIFMGDSGSLFLGVTLSGLMLIAVQESPTLAHLAAAVCFALVPLGDLILTMGRRALAGKHLFDGDLDHFYNKLIDAGLTHSQTVLVVYLIAGLGSALGIGLWESDSVLALALVTVLVVLLLYVLSGFGVLKAAPSRKLVRQSRPHR